MRLVYSRRALHGVYAHLRRVLQPRHLLADVDKLLARRVGRVGRAARGRDDLVTKLLQKRRAGLRVRRDDHVRGTRDVDGEPRRGRVGLPARGEVGGDGAGFRARGGESGIRVGCHDGSGGEG